MTSESAAHFSLLLNQELWRREVKDEIAKDMEVELARRAAVLEEKMKEKETAREKENEDVKARLEEMVARMKSASDAVLARESAVRLRENELGRLEADVNRRLQEARNERDREVSRAVEEARAKVSFAESRTQEEAAQVRALSERLRSQATAYDALAAQHQQHLREAMGREQMAGGKGGGGTDATTLRDEIRAMAQELSESRKRCQELEGQLSHYKGHVVTLVGQYNEVLARAHDLERREVQREAETLERRKAEMDSLGKRGGLPSGGGPTIPTQGLHELIAVAMGDEMRRMQSVPPPNEWRSASGPYTKKDLSRGRVGGAHKQQRRQERFRHDHHHHPAFDYPDDDIVSTTTGGEGDVVNIPRREGTGVDQSTEVLSELTEEDDEGSVPQDPTIAEIERRMRRYDALLQNH